jgi:hypothetical protein
LRSPSPSEINFFSGQLQRGVNAATVYNTFVNSSEHQNLVNNGMYTGTPLSTSNPTTFNTQFSANVSMANALPSVSYANIGTSGNVDTLVNNLYTTLLNRNASPSETAYWSGQIENGMSLNTAVAGFLNSGEYANLVANNNETYALQSGANGNTANDTAFANSLYVGLLDRSPSPSESSYWVGRLQAGMSANDVMAGFLTSAEYRNNTIGFTTGFMA